MSEENPTMVYGGQYVGREFRREYATKEGTKGKVFGIKVRGNPNSQFPKGFTAFDPSTKGLSDIQEGDWVKVLYKESHFTNSKGQASKSNVCNFIVKVTEEEAKKLAQEASAGSISKSEINMEKFDEFASAYKEAVKKKGMEPNEYHLMGSYLAKFAPGLVDGLKARCKKAIYD